MSQAIWLRLYRSYLLETRYLPDRSLKTYIRRRAGEDLRKATQLPNEKQQ